MSCERQSKTFLTKKKQKTVDVPSRLIEAAEVRFFPSALADASRKNVPQWLKPNVFESFCGTAEAVPFRE
jgi:hypothetical protein